MKKIFLLITTFSLFIFDANAARPRAQEAKEIVQSQTQEKSSQTTDAIQNESAQIQSTTQDTMPVLRLALIDIIKLMT